MDAHHILYFLYLPQSFKFHSRMPTYQKRRFTCCFNFIVLQLLSSLVADDYVSRLLHLFFFLLQNSRWALMINKTLPTMRGTQSVLVLAESEKDRDNYSLNRQSPRWRPHNQVCMCILGSFYRNAGQKLQKMKNRGNKVGERRSCQANTTAQVT